MSNLSMTCPTPLRNATFGAITVAWLTVIVPLLLTVTFSPLTVGNVVVPEGMEGE